MGLWPIEIFQPFSAGIDFRRQNLTALNVSKTVSVVKVLKSEDDTLFPLQ